MWIGQVRALRGRRYAGGLGAETGNPQIRWNPANSGTFVSLSSLEEGLQSSLGPAKNQRMHIMGPLIGIDRFEIQHVPHDTELV